MATPLEAVQTSPADVTSPTPVDTTGAGLPDASAAEAGPDSADVQSLPQNGGQSLQPNPTAQAQPPKPSLWSNVLRGALAGLEMGMGGGIVGAGVGALAGAADPKAVMQAKARRQQMAALRTQFASLQAANATLENSQRKWTIQHLPQEMQIKIADAQAPLVDSMIKQGVPFMVVDGDPSGKSEVAALHQLADANNGQIPVHSSFVLPDGREILFWDTDKMGQNKEQLSNINRMQIVKGAFQPGGGYTPQQFRALPKSTQQQLIHDSNTFFQPQGKNPDDRDQQVRLYKNYLARAQMLGDKDLADGLQGAISLLGQQTFAQSQQGKNMKAGMVGDQMKFALYDPEKGWLDSETKQPLPDFRPAPAYAQVALSVAQTRNIPTEGKMAEDVFKPALDADWRLGRMTEDYRNALKGDQQAMVSLLTNHIGMTLGLQKGARITKDILHEAQDSLPFLQKVEARFDSNGYLSGVVLSPEQMHQMLGLAQSQRQWVWRGARSQAEQLRGQGVRVVEPRSITQDSGEPTPPAPSKNANNASVKEPTATGPGGHKIVFRGGKWVDAQTGAAIQ